MNVRELATGKTYPIDILSIEKSDYKLLTSSRYFFNWREEENHETYKLVIRGQEDILGLVSIDRIPNEWRIHIRLLTVSKENKGKNKKYDKIAGNLLAFVSKLAVKNYGELACISLLSKSSIVKHYINKYNMKITGKTLSLEVPEIIDLINKYDHEE